MKIKKFLMLMVAFLVTTAFAACSDSKDNGGGGAPVSKLTVRPLALSFGSEGGETIVKAQAPVQASATSNAEWCQVTVGERSGDISVSPVTVTVSPNTTTYERSAVITITAGSESATVTVTQSEGEAEVPTGEITATANEIAKKMYPGWNLGNTMEASGDGLACETAWQPTMTTQAVIDAVAAAGFKSVRIPCSWNIHTKDGSIDAEWMARVKQVVGYCINKGLYVVLNDHYDGGWIEVEGFTRSTSAFKPMTEELIEAKKANLMSLWTQIANEFKDYDEHLLFAGMNEPFQQYDLFNGRHEELTPILIEYNKAFVQAVRATGGNNANRTLVVQGPSTNIDSSCDYMTIGDLPEEAGKLMFEVHFYDPGQFCGTFDASGDKAYYYWGAANHSTDHNATWGEEDFMQAQFAKMKENYTKYGFPVIIGEYAGLQRTLGEGQSQEKHNASVQHFYQCVNEYATNNGIVAFAWDTNDVANLAGEGGSSTIIDRAKCTVVGTNAMAGILAGAAAGVWPSLGN